MRIKRVYLFNNNKMQLCLYIYKLLLNQINFAIDFLCCNQIQGISLISTFCRNIFYDIILEIFFIDAIWSFSRYKETLFLKLKTELLVKKAKNYIILLYQGLSIIVKLFPFILFCLITFQMMNKLNYNNYNNFYFIFLLINLSLIVSYLCSAY